MRRPWPPGNLTPESLVIWMRIWFGFPHLRVDSELRWKGYQ